MEVIVIGDCIFHRIHLIDYNNWKWIWRRRMGELETEEKDTASIISVSDVSLSILIAESFLEWTELVRPRLVLKNSYSSIKLRILNETHLRIKRNPRATLNRERRGRPEYIFPPTHSQITLE
jgi:hypothetical protein